MDGLNKSIYKGHYMGESKKVARISFKIPTDKHGTGFKEYKKGDTIDPEDVKVAGEFAVDAVEAVTEGLGQEVLESQLKEQDAKIDELSATIAKLEKANDNLQKKVIQLEDEKAELEALVEEFKASAENVEDTNPEPKDDPKPTKQTKTRKPRATRKKS